MNKFASRPFQFFNKLEPQKIRNFKQGTERLAHRSLLEVKGPDSSALLQGLITNDMSALSKLSHGCIYAMFLNNKGRVMYDSIIYKIPETDNTYLVEVDRSVALTLCKHLIIHKLRKEVSVKNVDEEYQLWVNFDLSSVPTVGASPIEVINEEMDYDVSDVVKNFKFADPRVPELGSRIITCVHKSCNFVNDYLAVAYKNLRYRLGIAEGIDELPVGNCFPLEANCDYLNGVSFDKGCYLGQELTARSFHTGVIRKRYMPLYIKEKLPNLVVNVNDIVEANKKSIGKIRGFDMHTGLGIGLLRIREALSEGCVSVGSLKLITLAPYWWPKGGVKETKEHKTFIKTEEPSEFQEEPQNLSRLEFNKIKQENENKEDIKDIKIDLIKMNKDSLKATNDNDKSIENIDVIVDKKN